MSLYILRYQSMKYSTIVPEEIEKCSGRYCIFGCYSFLFQCFPRKINIYKFLHCRADEEYDLLCVYVIRLGS